ncbi:lipopolysaccharide core biosynthesis protein RfaG [Rubritalea halochordaticola]|uniref:Lipopolysaccharide core biosynthesis protein RfaG n=1 Tax=Rubritalea halochordaticola TaxID=714537 RepID=A0ABP9UZ20_9BACT
MKIAVIRSECSYTKGGAERYAANFCRELCELGHSVWLLAEKFSPDVHPYIKHIPVKVNRLSSFLRTRSFNANAQTALKDLDVDAVVALSRSYPSNAFRVSDPLHRFWMKIRYPNKVQRFLQTLNPRHKAILDIESAILNPENTKIIITNSQLSKTLIGEYYEYPMDRIHVIYNGVDQNQFTADTSLRDKEELQLLFVGQDFKRKGLAAVIHALAASRKAGHQCSLRVIGRDNPETYQSLAASLGIAQYVHFEGPSRKIQDAYRQADLFVFPSLYDPFANVVLESLSCGLPAITTTTNGSSEIITEAKDGYVIAGTSDHIASDIAKKIDHFCSLSPEQRQAMRLQARATAEKYTISHNTRQFVKALSATC